MTDTTRAAYNLDTLDYLAIEREARDLRARAVADAARAFALWLRASFARTPGNRTA